MSEYMTKEMAYEIYIKENYYELMPFKDDYCSDFIDYLNSLGITIIDID